MRAGQTPSRVYMTPRESLESRSLIPHRVAHRTVHAAASGEADLERRWRVAPISSQIAKAVHSAGEKWPGKAGTSFISRRSKETQIPRPVRKRMRGRGSTSQKETQAA